MYVTSTVIDRHDKDFRVDVCPYEGGSDHSIFLQSHVPALLTWHFTDYNYHTSTDTLYMASPREMESVGLTTLACALMMSDSCTDADAAADILGAVKEAGLKKNRKYYVQVRTYKTVKGRKYYSAWSRKKTVKTR